MAKKLFNIGDDVAAELDKEDPGKQSAIVDVLLHQHYNLPLEGDGAHIRIRQEIASIIIPYQELSENPKINNMLEDDTPTTTFIPSQMDVTPAMQVVTTETAGQLETAPAVVPALTYTPTEAPQSPVALVSEPLPSEVVPSSTPDNTSAIIDTPPAIDPSQGSEEAIMANDTLSVEAQVIAPVDPTPAPEVIVEEPTGQVNGEVPIRVNGQPGGVCDIHGTYQGSACPECLLDAI